ncbi:hypothetical protein THARTR1_11020 [Trichoderma harzianum]|uniref:Aflatoxin regulatory protein domain-containing protein n=1 Tax=Trichoderma harzianum TaxID=5544 RepID=A0A2K0TG35_TRIHA|nr:hypothetical protein THARTR1_11020 [Trichoderma harzianum]
MPYERGVETSTASVTSVPGDTVTNMITNCDDCFESAHVSQNFMSKGLFNNETAAIDYSNIFSAFVEDRDSMSSGLVDTGSEMDRLGFFQHSPVSERYQLPFHDIASILMPIEDTTGFTPISESLSMADASSCSCCSSTGRSDSSSARFSSIDHSTVSLAAVSAEETSPADIPQTMTCQCLDQALQLLNKVSESSRTIPWSVDSHYSNQPSQAVSQTRSTTPDGDGSSVGFGVPETRSQWFHAVLSENREYLGAMDSILACPGTDEDNMLPTILCMILLKMLDRYSNVAGSCLLLSDNRSRDIAELGSNMSGYLIVETGPVASTIHRHTFITTEQEQMQHINYKDFTTSFDRGTSQSSNGEYLEHTTAHLVLGELHWVQRLLNQLVTRFESPDCYNANCSTQQSCGWERRQQPIPLPMEEPADPGLTSSFSAGTLGHMATNVQKRLTTLSTSIINQLHPS